MRKVSMLWFWVVSLALFIPVHYYSPYAILAEIFNGIALSIVSGIFVSYCPAMWEAMRVPPSRMKASQANILGVGGGSLGAAFIFGNLWVWRVVEAADAGTLLNHWTASFGRWLLISGAILVLASSRSDGDMIPRKSYFTAGVWVAIGVACGTMGVTFGLWKPWLLSWLLTNEFALP